METLLKSFSAGSKHQRLIMKFICISLILLLLIPASGISVSAGSSAEYYDDFESGSQNWDLSEGWQLKKIENNTVLEGTGHTWAVQNQGGWDNYAFAARFKIIKGTIHFNYRRSVHSDGAIRYFIGVNSTSLYLNKQTGDNFYDLDTAKLNLDTSWHEIEIKAYEGLINVSIDGVLYIAYTDEDFLASGGIAFETIENSDFLLDDVKITAAAAGDVATGPEAGQGFIPDKTHRGDLVLSGTEVMTIENEEYLQQGNVYINDHAKLIIRNSGFMLGRGDIPTIHVYINVGENATLEIDHSTIVPETPEGEMGALVIIRNYGTMTMSDSPTEVHLLEMYEGTLTIVNSEMVYEIGGLLQIAGGDTKVVNSTLGALGLTVPADAALNISDLKSGAYLESWDVHDVIPKANYSLVLKKTTLLKDDFEPGPYERGWLFFPDPDSHVKISDSELRKVFINLNGENATFDNLRIGMPSDLHYRDIQLDDIVMTGQWPFTITDSDVTITNSNYLFLQPSGTSDIALANSHMVEFIPRNFYGTISFENCTWTNAGEIIGGESYHSMTNDFTIKGSLKIASELREHLQWQDARVTREYDVAITGKDGKPICGLTVKINGQTNVSDENGKVRFSLIFDEYNYNRPEKLQVFNGNVLVSQKDIDFFTETPVIFADTLTALPTGSNILVNGQKTAFEAYSINGSNYFKLRDLAKALSGTKKQFEVAWDGAGDAIRITAGKVYTSVGGELVVSGNKENKSAVLTTSSVYLDGVPIKLTAYNTGGNNYFKLRDVAAAIDFGVTWDGNTNTISIDTSTGYTKG
ncbi:MULTISPECIES: stalk domain-containing protein [unclassified Dehalobacter]|uniref:stalk domain-containing protein n=1 Tax=unclassified Dehalobacter TaxID=2635733 RepID=UPI000E6CBB3B|nr:MULTISPECIES: stalk domain-containing protein [unclassified Dehalobacter]RJE46621.1 hypothetical protein A7K50_12715 [Dehalobacter sp. MCB1]TCX47388.1 hypothetical protein C1I36_13875 [Dehalobacter sp. 14DCB1]TCX55601.1 hypothetical protein C1I38_02840 [Dehalobacter sp. 12DCB1]